MNIYNNFAILILIIIIGYFSLKYLFFILLGIIIGIYISRFLFYNKK
jgi:hypothetical protein